MDERHTWIALVILSVVLHGALLQMEFFSPASAEGTVPVTLETLVPEQRTAEGISLTAEMAPSDPKNQGESLADKRQRVFAEYLKEIRRTIEANKFQPLGEDFSDLIGRVTYVLTVGESGRFVQVRLARSSGNPRLDRTALLAIRTSSGRVKRPPLTGDHPLSLPVTVKYQYGL
jgi:protein TonB